MSADNGAAIYAPAERGIFRFWDGTKERAIDPLAAYRKLLSYPGLDIQADAARAELGESDSIAILLQASREALGVEPFRQLPDGSFVGMLDEEVEAAIGRLHAYMGELKKSTSRTPTSPSSSAGSGADQTTSASSAFG